MEGLKDAKGAVVCKLGAKCAECSERMVSEGHFSQRLLGADVWGGVGCLGRRSSSEKMKKAKKTEDIWALGESIQEIAES